VARATELIGWYGGPTVVETSTASMPARQPDELALRLPVQAVYKFDGPAHHRGPDRERPASRSAEEIVVMPSGRTARVRSIESWPEPAEPPRAAGAGQSSASRWTARYSSTAATGSRPRRVRPKAAQRLRARVFWLHEEPLAVGTSLNVRIAPPRPAATIVAIEKAVDPGALSATEATAVRRTMWAKIDIALARSAGRRSLRGERPYRAHRARPEGPHLGRRTGAFARSAPPPSRGATLKPAVSPQERAVRTGHGAQFCGSPASRVPRW